MWTCGHSFSSGLRRGAAHTSCSSVTRRRIGPVQALPHIVEGMPRSPLVMGAETERDRANRLGIARMAVVSSLIATGVARRLLGVPAEYDNGAARLAARLAGVRNLAMGAWTLQIRDHSKAERRLCYQLNAAVDAADVAV